MSVENIQEGAIPLETAKRLKEQEQAIQNISPFEKGTGADSVVQKMNESGATEKGVASGVGAVSLNQQNSATADNSVATGFETNATGECSFSMGRGTLAYGEYAVAEGAGDEDTHLQIAGADYSHTEGLGNRTIQGADCSHVGGRDSVADENSVCAFVHGDHLEASAADQAVFGRYNTTDSTALLIVGGGSDDAPSNVFEAGIDTTGDSPEKFIMIGSTMLTESKLRELLGLDQ